jgi:hypothetical protein
VEKISYSNKPPHPRSSLIAPLFGFLICKKNPPIPFILTTRSDAMGRCPGQEQRNTQNGRYAGPKAQRYNEKRKGKRWPTTEK